MAPRTFHMGDGQRSIVLHSAGTASALADGDDLRMILLGNREAILAFARAVIELNDGAGQRDQLVAALEQANAAYDVALKNASERMLARIDAKLALEDFDKASA